MIIAKWEDKKDFACFSNTIDGAVSCLLNFIPEDETGVIYIYKDDRLIDKVHKTKN